MKLNAQLISNIAQCSTLTKQPRKTSVYLILWSSQL